MLLVDAIEKNYINFHSLLLFGSQLRYAPEVAEAPSAQWQGMFFPPNIAVKKTWKTPLTHFLCKEIKHLKSISGKCLMLPLIVQENNMNIKLLFQVTAVSVCAPPENKHLPVLHWDDLISNGWLFYSQGCRRHRARQGTRTTSLSSPLLRSLLSLEGACPQLSFDHSFLVSSPLDERSSC